MSAVRPFDSELDGYAYLPRMFDKARAKLAGDTSQPRFGCPLDHSCLARLGVYPEEVLELVRVHGEDDHAILAGLQERGIPEPDACWFDAQATEDQLLTDVYLRVRPIERLDEIDPRPGDRVIVIEAGEATITLGSCQARIVRPDDVVRIPPDLPHEITQRGAEHLIARELNVL
jgi:hypothetical protein